MTFLAPVPWEADEVLRAARDAGKNSRSTSGRSAPVRTCRSSTSKTGGTCSSAIRISRRAVSVRRRTRRQGGRSARRLRQADSVRRPGGLGLEKEGIPLKAKFLQGYYDFARHRAIRHGSSRSIFDDKNSRKSRRIFRDHGVQMPRTLEMSNWYLGFNWLDPVVGKGDTPDQQVRNRKLRQALSIAIDWEEFVRVFEAGSRRTRDGTGASGVFGFRKDAINRVVYDVVDGQPRPSRSMLRRNCSPKPATPTAATQDRRAAGAEL